MLASTLQIKRWLGLAGWQVHLNSDRLPDNVAGQAVFTTREVLIRPLPSERSQLLVLIHEAGHALEFNRFQAGMPNFGSGKPNRERAAYIFGWAIIRYFGIDVSKAEWQAASIAAAGISGGIARLNGEDIARVAGLSG